jgi:hypothetical protein
MIGTARGINASSPKDGIKPDSNKFEEEGGATSSTQEELSISYLVSQLMEGSNLVVENYLNTLDVEERSRVVDKMNSELLKLDIVT